MSRTCIGSRGISKLQVHDINLQLEAKGAALES